MSRFSLILFCSFINLLLAQVLPPRTILPHLHSQALSHISFHASPLKLHLAKLLPPPATVVIVGVEYGTDIALFASNAYKVFGFEPVSKYLDSLNTLLTQNPTWNVTLIPHAAAAESGASITVEYEELRENVRTVRVDEQVLENVGVMSIDVQGAEFDVLRGAVHLLKSGRVNALWVEMIACVEGASHVLDLLEELGYVIWDFVPWGKKFGNTEKVPRELNSFLFEPERPGTFKEYSQWLCEQKNASYEWLQTDLVAVRADIVTNEWITKLERVADDVCKRQDSNCLLRELLLDEEDDLEKEDL